MIHQQVKDALRSIELMLSDPSAPFDIAELTLLEMMVHERRIREQDKFLRLRSQLTGGQ